MIDPVAFGEAVSFAAEHHRSQVRKDANRTPYISHLIAVSALALEDGGTQTHAIAALLHDTLEDCPTVSEELLIEEFGDEVARIVVACTDTPPDGVRQSYRAVKQAYVDHLRDSNEDVLLVSNADKLHNLSTIVADFEEAGVTGHAALAKFSSPEDVAWYYNELGKVFADRRPETRNTQRFATLLGRLNSYLND